FSDHPITNSPDSLNLVMLSEVRRRARLRTKSKHPDAASSAHAESGHSHETVSGFVILSEVRRSNATEDEVEGSMHVPLRSSWFCNLDCATCPGGSRGFCHSRNFCHRVFRSPAHPISRSPDHPIHHPAQLDYLNLLRTLHPVVPPAHDHVALRRIVPVQREVAALILGLDPHPLPLARLDLPLGFNVRILPLHRFNLESQLARQHAKQNHHTHLVGRRIAQRAGVKRRPHHRPFVIKHAAAGHTSIHVCKRCCWSAEVAIATYNGSRRKSCQLKTRG